MTSAALPDPLSPGFADSLAGELIQAGVLDPVGADRARLAARQTGERFDLVLMRLGLVPEVELGAVLARLTGLDFLRNADHLDGFGLPEGVDRDFLLRNRILPLADDGDGVRVAIVDPLDPLPLQALRYALGRPVDAVLTTPAAFEAAWARLDVTHARPAAAASPERASEQDLQRLRDIASEAPVIRLVNQLISSAVDMRASDVHVEPTPSGVVVRCRVDGALRVVQTVPMEMHPAILSRIKIMGGLDIAERRLPQDGRIKLAIRGNDIDFRLSTIPTVGGESAVIRILDRSRIDLDFARLGFAEDHVAQLAELMRMPDGVVFVTGPTGSGKTTTLYTVLKELNAPDVKIFTVEDPVEYQLAGINQVQVNAQIGLDFPTCLRSILRQDPDIIMVGEIRDAETATMAFQASLTGHIVFSTLHTNDAASTVTRLTELGVERFLIGSTLKAVMAQRLVRRICPHCAAPHPDAPHWEARLAGEFPALRAAGPAKLMRGRGCRECQESGFKGRLTIAELMPFDERLRGALYSGAPDHDLRRLAREGGSRSMVEDGMAKAWAGLTTVEDVLRATQQR
ncbi:MAG: GspE/PulE family protein [Alsobacter sp.]